MSVLELLNDSTQTKFSKDLHYVTCEFFHFVDLILDHEVLIQFMKKENCHKR